jgi:cation transport ATPase
MFASIAFVACNSTEQSNTEAKEEMKKTEVLAENKTEVKMEIEGMVCAMGCAKYIEDNVADLNGIVASKVDFESAVATFEFDKTAMSAEDIETFISEIHDGQYKAKVLLDQEIETTTEEVEKATKVKSETPEEESSISAVREKINFNFPELLTYFLKQLR